MCFSNPDCSVGNVVEELNCQFNVFRPSMVFKQFSMDQIGKDDQIVVTSIKCIDQKFKFLLELLDVSLLRYNKDFVEKYSLKLDNLLDSYITEIGKLVSLKNDFVLDFFYEWVARYKWMLETLRNSILIDDYTYAQEHDLPITTDILTKERDLLEYYCPIIQEVL